MPTIDNGQKVWTEEEVMDAVMEHKSATKEQKQKFLKILGIEEKVTTTYVVKITNYDQIPITNLAAIIETGLDSPFWREYYSRGLDIEAKEEGHPTISISWNRGRKP